MVKDGSQRAMDSGHKNEDAVASKTAKGIVKDNSSQRASLGNDDANQAGSFFVEMKPFLSVDQQVRHLIEMGIECTDASAAKELLSDVNYYRLRAYWMTFEHDGEIATGTELSSIVDIYRFDAELRQWLWAAMQPIEIKMRTSFAYFLSRDYGPLAYRDSSLFADGTRHGSLLSSIDQEIARAKKNQEPCVCHNLEKYGDLPCWAVVEVMTMGQVSSLIGLLRDGSKVVPAAKAIADAFGQRPPILKSWLMHLCAVRNLCAHQGRFYNRVMRIRPKMLRKDICWASNKEFPTFIVIKRLFEQTWPARWNEMAIELGRIIDAYPDVSLAPMGFPDCWREVLGVPKTDAGSEAAA